MLATSEMDPSALGTVDDSFDPNIFNILDLGSTAGTSNDQVDFEWVDEFITSTETCEPADVDQAVLPQASCGQDVAASSAGTAAISLQQQLAPLQATQQQQLLQNVLQQQQTPAVGKVIMAMGQPSTQPHTQTLATISTDAGHSATATATAMLTAGSQQTPLLHAGSVTSQSVAPPFILKSTPHIQLVSSSVQQNTAAMGAQQQFVPAATGLGSVAASQRSSHSLTSSAGQAHAPASQLSGINLLHVQQPQLTHTTLPLPNFVAANQTNLQGHAVLTAQGSNIVHTQNALIQNPNVVNVNVAHVLSNQLPQFQVLQTAQGKIYVQTPAGSQGLPQQLCLSQVAGAPSVQVAGSQATAMQMAGQPMQLAGAQTMQVTSNVGLAQSAVIAQPQSSVALGSGGAVGQQQASYNVINIGGSQGQILVQRMPSSAPPVTQTQSLPQVFLRTVNGQQQLIQQPTLQSTPSTTQLPQQLVAQAGATTHNIPLQQLLSGVGGHSLRLVGHPQATPTAAHPVSGLSTSTSTVVATSTPQSIVLQPLQVTANQMPLLGQALTTQAGSSSGTVTLNLSGGNLNLQQFQNLPTLQLTGSQTPQPIILQQQQQIATTMQKEFTTKVSASKKVKTKAAATAVSSAPSSSLSLSSTSASGYLSALSADNILSAAVMSSGILEDEEFCNLMNGGDMSDMPLIGQPEVSVTPSPSSLPATPTPPPPPLTLAPKKKSKKKKKPEQVVSSGVVQHVVLSSGMVKSASAVTITTASATVVTTTVTPSVLSTQGVNKVTASVLSAQGVNRVVGNSNGGVQTLIGSPLVSLTTTTTSVPTTTTPITVLPALTLPTTTFSKQGLVKQVVPSPKTASVVISNEERQELLNIQTQLNRLKEQVPLDTSSLALMQQLDMRRRKIIAAHGTATLIIKQQHQNVEGGMVQIRLQGQAVGASNQPQTATPSVQAERGVQGKGALQVSMHNTTLVQTPATQAQLQFVSQPLDVKPVLGTPSTPVMPKSHSKLNLLSPKPDPATAAHSAEVDVKPVVGLGSVEVPASNCGLALTPPTGKVIMAMANPPGPQGATAQPRMVRIQFGGHNTAQAVAFPPKPAAAAATAQHVVLSSTHKLGLSGGVVTTAVTATPVNTTQTVSQGTAADAAEAPPPPRPVQIKIANQVLTVQLTQGQQEKLELHLSRMTLEQQQAFLRQQRHVLAKLQHRVDSQATAQRPQMPQQTVGSEAAQQAPAQSSSSSTSVEASAAPVVVAVPGSVVGDGATPAPTLVQQGVQVMSAAPAALSTPTPAATVSQQLPVTVQALVGSQSKTESDPVAASGTSTTTMISLRGLNLEIPKSSLIHSQLNRDQEHAVSPDTKTPFKDHREACRRLLRYHVHQSRDPSIAQMEEFDQHFEVVSKDLIEKKDVMFAKYRHLLLKDSMRMYPTSEQVQISRIWCNDMTLLQQKERDLVNTDPDNFVPMPASYLEKDLTKVEEEESEQEVEEEEESQPPSEEDEEEEEREQDENEEEGGIPAESSSPEQERVLEQEAEPCEHPSPRDYFHGSPPHHHYSSSPSYQQQSPAYQHQSHSYQQRAYQHPTSPAYHQNRSPSYQHNASPIHHDQSPAYHEQKSPASRHQSPDYHNPSPAYQDHSNSSYQDDDVPVDGRSSRHQLYLAEDQPVSPRTEREVEDQWDDMPTQELSSEDGEEVSSDREEHITDVSSDVKPNPFTYSMDSYFKTSTPVHEEEEEDEEEEEEEDRSHHTSHSSPAQQESFTTEEQSSFQSESSRSSPPHPPPEPPKLVKLVIRNDGSGFTSKLLEKHRSTDHPAPTSGRERRSLRSRSHSWQDRGEGASGGGSRKGKNESTVKEEVEYIDVDNSKYSKGVSVKLERLSERTSQEYGLHISRPGASSNTQKSTTDISPVTATAGPSTSSHRNSKSGRKRRGGVVAEERVLCPPPSDYKKVKKERRESSDFSSMKSGGDYSVVKSGDHVSVKGDDYSVTRSSGDFSGLTSSYGGGCEAAKGCGSNELSLRRDLKQEGECNVFREVKEERGFYVGCASESLDHFDSEDDDYGVVQQEEGRGERMQSVIDTRGQFPTHGASHLLHSPSSYNSEGRSESRRLEHTRGGYEGGRFGVGLNPNPRETPMFSPSLSSSSHYLHSRRLGESVAIETTFDLDHGDPQSRMVNPQMQSAIDSILNGSMSSAENYSSSFVHDTGPSVSEEEESGGSHPRPQQRGQSSSPYHRWDPNRSPHDLDVVVRSILR